jgi:hypothetical protein
MFKHLTLSGLLLLALTACGGNQGASIGTGGGSGGGGSGGGSGGGGGTITPTYQMGGGSGPTFQPGIIAIATPNLAAGGTTSIQVSIVDQNNALYTTSTQVTFSSTCLAIGTATISSGTPPVVGNSVTTSTGTVIATYTAKGCSGPDVITATASVASGSLSATGTVNVASATIGSIKFISATPTTIGLKGTGLVETSTVVFQVVDSSGGPVPNVPVTFSLPTSVGGLSLAPASSTSGVDGNVQTVVSAGTAHTAIRVTATIANPARSTQSGILTVTTGLPASDAFSIAVDCPNVEAYNYDGVKVGVTVRLADRYNNPAPEGTSVAFTTSGGHIDGSCVTSSAQGVPDGTCTANWVSANPRPSPAAVPPSLLKGRAVVLATAIGEESFNDSNANGYYDSGEAFTNLGEPFRDDNESGAYELNEYYLDFNGNQTRNAGDGTFKGVTCTGTSPSDTCSAKNLAIGAQIVIVMSTSSSIVTGPADVAVPSGTTPVHVVYNVKDANGNAMPSGTVIHADLTGGGTLQGWQDVVVPCDGGTTGQDVDIYITPPTTAGSGILRITTTSPKKLLTTYTVTVHSP